MRLSKDFMGCSVSHGTHREADLIQSFMFFLEANAKRKYEKIKKKYPGVPFDDREQLESWVENNKDEASWLLHEELFEAMNEIAPKGCYFGAHPGDGSDFGFWKDDF